MCWGRYSVETAVNLEWSGWYYHEYESMPSYPFAFTSNPCFIPFKENGSEGVLVAAAKGTTTAPPQLYLVRPTTYNSAYYDVMMFVIGRWK